jgi:catechol 2,3-dioxygenase-like lactoylglutathione lyase family enzyme
VIRGLNHLTFAVGDLEESFDFYVRILGLSPVARWEGGAYLLAGEDWITLVVDATVRDSRRPDYTHAAFTVAPDDFDEISRRVLEAGAQSWQENGTAFWTPTATSWSYTPRISPPGSRRIVSPRRRG